MAHVCKQKKRDCEGRITCKQSVQYIIVAATMAFHIVVTVRKQTKCSLSYYAYRFIFLVILWRKS